MFKNTKSYDAYFAPGVTDLRKSINGLSLIVQKTFLCFVIEIKIRLKCFSINVPVAGFYPNNIIISYQEN